jgi:hypothetical protein
MCWAVGVVAYADLKPDYTRRPDPKRLLLLLSAMKKFAAH